MHKSTICPMRYRFLMIFHPQIHHPRMRYRFLLIFHPQIHDLRDEILIFDDFSSMNPPSEDDISIFVDFSSTNPWSKGWDIDSWWFFIHKSIIGGMRYRFLLIFHPQIHDLGHEILILDDFSSTNPPSEDEISIFLDFSSTNPPSEGWDIDSWWFFIHKSTIGGMRYWFLMIFHPQIHHPRMRYRFLLIFHPQIQDLRDGKSIFDDFSSTDLRFSGWDIDFWWFLISNFTVFLFRWGGIWIFPDF